MSTAGPSGDERTTDGGSVRLAGSTVKGVAPAFDLDEALAEIPGGLEMARELAALFPEEHAAVADRMRRGLADGDADAIRRGAHVLKSCAGIFAAHAAAEAASRLEQVAAAGNLPAAAAAMADFEIEFDRFAAALKTHFGTG